MSSTSALRQMLADSSTIPLISAAVITAGYASIRANDALLFKPRDSSHPRQDTVTLSSRLIDQNSTVLHASTALAFPVIAAISITLLFFFLRSVGIIFTILSTISSTFSLIFTLLPITFLLSSYVVPRYANQLSLALSITGAVTVICLWLYTGGWLVNNLIGVSLCILFASICKVPNLRVCTILFIGLFFYDIFFVFFSSKIFGKNVMVEVATASPVNPASALADWLNVPNSLAPVANLPLPAKLIIPTSDGNQALLGLGDIILPEILLTYLLQFDSRSNTGRFGALFLPSLLAYALALFISFYCNYAFRAAQPALLYIVPCVLGTASALALSRKQLPALWNGVMPRHPYCYGDDDDVVDAASPDEYSTLRSADSYTLINSNGTGSKSLAEQQDQIQQHQV